MSPTVDADMGIEEFRRKFPLGSKTQVVAVDPTGRYVGLALVADAHTPGCRCQEHPCRHPSSSQ
jgi:CIC family chloride channel protein